MRFNFWDGEMTKQARASLPAVIRWWLNSMPVFFCTVTPLPYKENYRRDITGVIAGRPSKAYGINPQPGISSVNT